MKRFAFYHTVDLYVFVFDKACHVLLVSSDSLVLGMSEINMHTVNTVSDFDDFISASVRNVLSRRYAVFFFHGTD
jgi:hypothetical protein